VSLYELAKRVDPEQIEEYESKVIWKGNDRFVYLIRENNAVYLRLSGSEIQLVFYDLEPEPYGQNWLIATEQEYKEIVELWQSEITNKI
jgi:hypothetical protein